MTKSFIIYWFSNWKIIVVSLMWLEGHRSCVWGERGLGPVGRKKAQQRHWTFPWRATSRADVGGNLAAIWTRPLIFLPDISQQHPQRHFCCSEEITSIDLSSRTIFCQFLLHWLAKSQPPRRENNNNTVPLRLQGSISRPTSIVCLPGPTRSERFRICFLAIYQSTVPKWPFQTVFKQKNPEERKSVSNIVWTVLIHDPASDKSVSKTFLGDFLQSKAWIP